MFDGVGAKGRSMEYVWKGLGVLLVLSWLVQRACSSHPSSPGVAILLLSLSLQEYSAGPSSPLPNPTLGSILGS